MDCGRRQLWYGGDRALDGIAQTWVCVLAYGSSAEWCLFFLIQERRKIDIIPHQFPYMKNGDSHTYSCVCVCVCVWELVEITHIRISSMLLGTQEHSLNGGNVSSTTQKVTNIESWTVNLSLQVTPSVSVPISRERKMQQYWKTISRSGITCMGSWERKVPVTLRQAWCFLCLLQCFYPVWLLGYLH